MKVDGCEDDVGGRPDEFYGSIEQHAKGRLHFSSSVKFFKESL